MYGERPIDRRRAATKREIVDAAWTLCREVGLTGLSLRELAAQSSQFCQHRRTFVMGLRRIGHTVEVEDTPSVRGMINLVNYLVKVEGE